MGLRIKTNTQSLIAQRNLSRSTADMGQNLERLSSGYRINRSSDDAAGLAISESLRGKIRGLHQAQRNASDGISLIQIAEGSMAEVSNIIIRLRELTVQSASDTVGNKERSYLNKEYVQLVDEIDRIVNTTEYNGTKLLRSDSGSSELVIQIGMGAGEEDNSDTLVIPMSEMVMDSESLGFAKGEVIGPLDPNGEVDRQEVASTLNTIDNSLSSIAGQRATLGSTQSRLNTAINNLQVTKENLSAANSRIRDVDFASETASLTQNRIIAQAGTAVLGQANAVPEMALNLLR